MTGFAIYRKLEYAFPTKEVPRWASEIDRWYQLDPFAYGLASAYFNLKHPKETAPDFILLASAAASNETDFQFAQTGATSPSKFVHTLPSVRGSTLCQIMKWKGPLLCIQHDPNTQIAALREAMDLLSNTVRKIWVFSITDNYCVHWFDIQPEISLPNDSGSMFKIGKCLTTTDQVNENVNDRSFQSWMSELDAPAFSLPGNYSISHLI